MKPHVPPRRSEMNRTEQSYALGLEARRRAGEVREYHYEAIKLKIGPHTWYTPDFLVIAADGEVQIHEVKGYWRDDAKVKTRAILDRYPFRVFVNGEEWKG